MTTTSDRQVGTLHHVVHSPVDPVADLVFLHPNPLDSAAWMYQFADFGHTCRCVGLDFPGYGLSGPLRASSTPELARQCWDTIDELEPTSTPLVLVGSSIGAFVAREMYLQRKDSVAALVLSGASWRSDKSFALRRAADYEREGIGFRPSHIAQSVAHGFRTTAAYELLVEMYTRRSHTTDVGSIIGLFRLLHEPDRPELQAEIDAPVLVLAGEHDVAFEPAKDLVSRLPDGRFTPIADAGHLCQLEQPATYNRHIRDFLNDRLRIAV
jgi:pimeloyl-ACP methyl ester carboxylesterase